MRGAAVQNETAVKKHRITIKMIFCFLELKHQSKHRFKSSWMFLSNLILTSLFRITRSRKTKHSNVYRNKSEWKCWVYRHWPLQLITPADSSQPWAKHSTANRNIPKHSNQMFKTHLSLAFWRYRSQITGQQRVDVPACEDRLIRWCSLDPCIDPAHSMVKW